MQKTIISLFVSGIVLSGCGVGGGEVSTLPGGNPVSNEIAKETGEKLAEEMMGGNVDLEYAEEGSGDVVAWPEQMPSDVPVFKYAEIEASMVSPSESGGAIVVGLKNVEKGAYDKYEQDLKAAGWEITTDPGWTIEHITAEKGNFTIDIDAEYLGNNTAAFYLTEYAPEE